MKQNLLNKVEEIINALACNEQQPIEVRGATNLAIQLRAELQVIDEKILKKEVKEEPIIKEETKKEKPFFEEKNRKNKED